MDRMAELEEMIRAGWGDTRASKIPADWRTRKPKPEVSDFFTESPQPEEKSMIDSEVAQVMRNEGDRQAAARRGHPAGRRNRPRVSFEMRAAAMRARLQKQRAA